jgi:hypothetical protein
MRLTADVFSELVRSLRSNPPTGVEQRKAPRVGVRARVQVVLPGRPEKIEVWVRDIGAGGIGILCPVPLAEGAVLSLSFWDAAGAATSVPCEVRYCRKIPSGHFQIGARFKGDVIDRQRRRTNP